MDDINRGEPYQLGRACAAAGGDIESSPFKAEPLDFIQWIRGFRDGQTNDPNCALCGGTGKRRGGGESEYRDAELLCDCNVLPPQENASSRIKLFLGDITSLEVDVIVTAANDALCGGGGVDGAVHEAAGPELVRASMALAPCFAGEARITDAFELSAKYIIHAVGPIFADIDGDTPVLRQTYRSALALAAEHDVASIAFPCISTGAFGFPHDTACKTAITAVTEWLHSHERPRVVTFCCFEPQDYARYRQRLQDLGLE